MTEPVIPVTEAPASCCGPAPAQASPCCGTSERAEEAGACCDPQAQREAAATGCC
ncbi:hypothetical protein ABZ128_11120 [Streptomyces sp. NPDC006326]|uniref:hypothetical protein n=1 Tax=Streptomyces sp. NPDC006326 TaxID=3156752 RepID=UPI0033A0EA22